MHELGLTEEIVSLACAAALREGARSRVTKIVVEVGRLSMALPEALRACFSVCAEGTAAEGAELELLAVPGLGRCRACGKDVPMDRALTYCACGSGDLEWLSGEELKLKVVEVLPCA